MFKARFNRRTALVIAAIALAIVVVSVVIAQKSATRKTAAASGQRPGARRPATTQTGPIRPADPNLAPEAAVDEALYVDQEFFGATASVARPYADALVKVDDLITKYPKDARLRLSAAKLNERLGKFDQASAQMVTYADLKKHSPDALRRLADYYHHRVLSVDEVKTLEELARSLPVDQRAAVYKRAATVVQTHALKQFKPADFFAELVAADPSNVQPVKDYVDQLRLAGQNKDALSVLIQFQPKFPSELAYFLKTRAQVLEGDGDRRAAEDVYSTSFDPNWPRAIAADYYNLLRRYGRYRSVRRELQDKVRSGATDIQTAGRLFSIYSYEGNYAQASRVLRDLEARRAGNTAQSGDGSRTVTAVAQWTAPELQSVAQMFSSIGAYDQASRYLYTLYLMGGLSAGSQGREGALAGLFSVMLDSAGSPVRLASGDLSFYRDVAANDEHPGFMNGVLSLILSGTDPSTEFAAEEKAAAGYFNRAFAYRIFTAFKQEYPQSPRLGDMYLGVVNVFSELGEYKVAIETGREFQQKYTTSPSYYDVSLRIADCYVALKDRNNERAVLAELLERAAAANPKGMPLIPIAPKRWSYGTSPQLDNLIDKIKYNIEAYSDTYDPTEGAGGESGGSESESSEESSGESTQPTGETRKTTYSDILERCVSSLAADDKKTETVAFFWGQIKKHPHEEGLYERFLQWLGQAQLVNEQLTAYNSAIRQFNSNTWYHRLARWYVRQKRGKELSRYSRQLIDVFDEDEITEYLLRFAGYGASPAGDDMNWDEELAFELYSYAHNHFPKNLFFVRGMLTYLEKNDTARWEKLCTQYYFADKSIRDDYLSWLSKGQQLRAKYDQALSKSSQGNGNPPAIVGSPNLRAESAAPVGLTTYRIFAADAAAWLSHFDQAVDVYRDLVASYPGEPQYASRLADLARSFGQQNEGFYDESARVLSRMAEIYPSNHSYRISAGEAYAERSEFDKAGQQWDQLLKIEPGERNTYLEVATVYWDYYQFDQAIRVFKDLRTESGDPNIYAYRLGAVYEGKGDIDSAIAEYVRVLSEPGDGRDVVTKRLAQLSRRKGLPERIANAYAQARSAHPADWQLVIGFALYQVKREQQGEALATLRAEMGQSQDVAFLETMRDLFHGVLRPEDEQQAIARLASVARDEHESIMYNLQLALFMEQHKQGDGAISIVDKLVTQYPTNVGVVEESADFYWRAGLRDKAIDLYKRTLAASQGSYQRRFTLGLAKRQVDAGRPADAEATLRAFYAQNPADSEVFSALTRTLGIQNKQADLTALYQQALKDVRSSGLTGDDAKARVADLRTGMIATLDRLGKYQEAVDQYIEIINTYPEDTDKVGTAIDYAAQHNLSDRLLAYYEKLSKESNKNYRWQLVLAQIYESRDNLAGASDQYQIAIVNEPQRPDIRFKLAASLTRQQRYDDAIATLREGWTLAGRDPQWLMEVARIQVLGGKRDDAVQTVRQAMAAKKNANAYARLAVAAQLSSWGLNGEAANIYGDVFDKLPKTLKDDYVNPTDVSGYVKVLVRTAPVATVFQKVEKMRDVYLAISVNSKDTDAYKAGSIVNALDQAMRTDFGQGVIDFATSGETSDLSSAIGSVVSPLTSYADKDRMVRYLGIARGAGLIDLEEKIHIQLKDAAFKARTKPEDSSFYNELRDLLAFYNRRSAFNKAAEVLSAEFSRDPYKDHFDYQSQIATEYRLLGDTSRELESLARVYEAESGAGVTTYSDWVGRYFDLLYSQGKKYDLARLASQTNPHQLQLINFLIEKGEKDMARTAIANAGQRKAWVASRSAEVGLYLKDYSPETENFFKAALNPGTIGEMLGRGGPNGSALIGNDWGVSARNYGYWLGAQDSRQDDSRRYLAGEIELHPGKAEPQLELAGYFLNRKDTARASDHTDIAAELAPGSKSIPVMRGAIAFTRGDRKGAIAAWGEIMGKDATVADAQLYLKLMDGHGLFADSLPRLGLFISEFVTPAAPDKDNRNDIEAIKPLLRDISARAGSDDKLRKAVAGLFQNVVERSPDDLQVAKMVVEEQLLPDSLLGFFYRAEHQRLSNIAASVAGTSQYDAGAESESGNPAAGLSEWRHKLLDYLIRTGAFNEARLLVATIQKEQQDLALSLKPVAVSESTETVQTDRYDWLPLASAAIELRSGGDTAAAVAGLRRYCGLPDSSSGSIPYQSDGHLNQNCLKAYALLATEHKDAEAEALLYDAYRLAASSHSADEATVAGLAEIEARHGHADEATSLLKRMVLRSADYFKAVRLAAETSARIGRFADAIDYRQQIARANPDDSVNSMELARVLQASGKSAESIDRLAALIAQRTTPNTVRAQCAEVIGDIVSADKSQAAHARTALEPGVSKSDAGALLAQAAVELAAGDSSAAASYLGRINTGTLAAVAELKLGVIQMKAGRNGEALSAFEQSLYLDPDATVTYAVAFRVPGPRVYLIPLYAQAGRDLAAVRLAEDQGSAEKPVRPVISAAVLNALTSSSTTPTAAIQTAVFEPPIPTPGESPNRLKTVSELQVNAALEINSDLLAALVDAATKLGQYDKAIAIERLRTSIAQKPEEKVSIEKRIAELVATQRAREAATAGMLRIDRANTGGSIYADYVIGR